MSIILISIFVALIILDKLDGNDVVFIFNRSLRKEKAELLRRKAAREEARNEYS